MRCQECFHVGFEPLNDSVLAAPELDEALNTVDLLMAQPAIAVAWDEDEEEEDDDDFLDDEDDLDLGDEEDEEFFDDEEEEDLEEDEDIEDDE